MRVLIVEDEPNLGRQLRSTLEGAGYAVDLATDGEDGHYLGSTENYDAVILDLGLPEVDGLTVLDRWRKEGRKMPVLAVRGEVHGIAGALQGRAQLATEIGFVFDDQNAHRCFLELFMFAPSTRLAAIGCLTGTKLVNPK